MTECAEATHGIVYGLVDPRTNQVRYVGQTKQTLDQRLKGHYGKASRRVRAWLEELKEAGLKPLTVPLREGVPADDLQDVETEEITRIIGAGGTLLNEVKIGLGRDLNHRRLAAEKTACWGDLARVTLNLLGGPLPPGDLPAVEIPDSAWRYMAQVRPGRDQDGIEWRRPYDDQRALHVAGRWSDLRWIGNERFCKQMDYMFSVATELPWRSRSDAARAIGLIPWLMAAVEPWWHLAAVGGLELDVAAFTAWAGRDAGTREALEFLLSIEDDGMFRLIRLADTRHNEWETGTGHLLATIAASYSGGEVEGPLRNDICESLRKFADDHELTQPMADLLMTLDPQAMDHAFGPDIAADFDRDLGLDAGTSGRVLRALVENLEQSSRVGEAVRKAADRSLQTLPVATLPDYGRWHGSNIPAARSISASLVNASLAEPDSVTSAEYVAKVRGLWTPQIDEVRSAAA